MLLLWFSWRILPCRRVTMFGLPHLSTNSLLRTIKVVTKSSEKKTALKHIKYLIGYHSEILCVTKSTNIFKLSIKLSSNVEYTSSYFATKPMHVSKISQVARLLVNVVIGRHRRHRSSFSNIPTKTKPKRDESERISSCPKFDFNSRLVKHHLSTLLRRQQPTTSLSGCEVCP